jgi:hypothetical protein
MNKNLLGFDWEWFIQEFLVKILLDIMHKYHSFALIIKLRSASPAHHL